MGDGRQRELLRRWQASGNIEDYLNYQTARTRLGEFKVERTKRLPSEAWLLNSLYRHLGGVLDFGMISCSKNPTMEDQRQAILAVFNLLIEEQEEYSRILKKKPVPWMGEIWKIQIDSHDIQGEGISLREFLGWQYDSIRQSLVLAGAFQAGLFTAPYDENDPDCLCDYSTLEDQWDSSLEIENGFAYAFAEPPYSMFRKTNQELNDLFRGFCYVLFGGLSEDLNIVRWGTDWTNYFEAGRDWWGDFLWTVHRPDSSRLTVIAGSASD